MLDDLKGPVPHSLFFPDALVHERLSARPTGRPDASEKHVAGGASGRPRSCRCLTGNAALLVASRGDLGAAGAPRIVLCFDIALGNPTGLAVAACGPEPG